MGDTKASTQPQSQSQSPGSTTKASGGRSRVISSCLICRRRKVKCDHVHPICGACIRGNYACIWADQLPGHTVTGRVSKSAIEKRNPSKNDNIQTRLERLEKLLEEAIAGQATQSPLWTGYNADSVNKEHDQKTSSSTSQTSHGSGVTSGDREGLLFLDGEQSQFVSPLHYALLADELQDIKALLDTRSSQERKEIPQQSLVDLLSLGRAGAGSELEQLLPETQEYRNILLDVYFFNVDPVVGITHAPTIRQKFSMYNREMHPIVFAIYFAAITSLPPSAVLEKFGESKEILLDRLQLGIEISLARENYLTTPSLEIFQGFVLWLVCITREEGGEENMSRAWVLLGIAFRIAFDQGLHQDPSLLPAGSMDVVMIESRRRLWHAICNLEFRAAEFKGQEPNIFEDSYTTLLPRNVDDSDLINGASPEMAPYNDQRFTSQSFIIVTYLSVRVVRKIIKSTNRLEKRMMDAEIHGTPRHVLVREIQDHYTLMKSQIDETKAEAQQKILDFCNTEVPLHNLCAKIYLLAEWRCHLQFWLRLARGYHDVALGEDLRTLVFEKSVICLEALNGISSDPGNSPFKWLINGLGVFQAIAHVLAELRDPSLDIPDRQQVITILQRTSIVIQSRRKSWLAVRKMIDKAVAEHNTSLRSRSQEACSHTNSITRPFISPSSTTTQANENIQACLNVPEMPEMPELYHNYPIQVMYGQYVYQPVPAQTQQMPLQPNLLNQVQTVQEHTPTSWNIFSHNDINNVMGKEQPNDKMDPNLDLGYWGDPVQYQSDPNTFPFANTFYPWID